MIIMLSSDVTNLPEGSTTVSGETHLQTCIGSELSLPNLVTRLRDSPEHRHPKGSSVRAAFDAFQEFALQGVKVVKPRTDDRMNASGRTGVDGYKAAKPGTLWFFRREFCRMPNLLNSGSSRIWYPLKGVRMGRNRVE